MARIFQQPVRTDVYHLSAEGHVCSNPPPGHAPQCFDTYSEYDVYAEVKSNYVIYPPLPYTCTTPASVAVEIPPVYTHDFDANLTAANGSKDFVLYFSNCPSALNKIAYGISSVGISPNKSNGLLPSTPDTGVAVQVLINMNGNYYAARLDQAYIIYENQDKSIKMRFQYYKIGDIVPGKVNAQMKITIEYQ